MLYSQLQRVDLLHKGEFQASDRQEQRQISLLAIDVGQRSGEYDLCPSEEEQKRSTHTKD